MNKQLLGQFYTTTNPFSISNAFSAWYQMIPKNEIILEPFAGAGHLFSYVDAQWNGFDLEPHHPDVVQLNTLQNFPTSYKVCITNPPYLAKTVVSRKKLPLSLNHEDLYLDALELCLQHCEYVAAIIPSTFWNQNQFKERLYAWDKMDMELFSDTDNPVGVAYFVPYKVQKTLTFINGKEVHLSAQNTPISVDFPVIFNPPNLSEFLVNGIDTIQQNNIHFRKSDGFDISKLINSEGKYKSTNRNMFFIQCDLLRQEHLPEINDMITQWRTETQDFFLTSFKSCKKDGKYRKRISFKEVRWLLCQYYGSLSLHI